MNKQLVLKAILQKIREEEAELKRNLEDTRRAAQEAPGAMESHSDTTRAQMQVRAGELVTLIQDKELAIRELVRLQVQASGQTHNLPLADRPRGEYGDAPAGETIQPGSLVSVEREGKTAWHLVLNGSGGTVAEVDGQNVLVITPKAPLGRALLGKKAEDVAPLLIGGKEIKLKILSAT
ncbi:MAG: GreA/GreB family elongation factor [Candidatus Liptonbacteria bacterium]|nr:GreA/GreB family elongation factor [Candidatus Liptonbacteria bacterium]